TAALLYRVVCAEPHTDGLPEEIRSLIERCLAKDPQYRPTAAQFLAELSAAQPGAHPLTEPANGGLRGHGPAGPAPDDVGWAMAPPAHPATARAAPADLRRSPEPPPALILTPTSAPAAVTIEPVKTPGANPFTPPAGTDQPGPGPLPRSGGLVPGGTPGLYGGTLRTASCNPQQMVNFLGAHPDKAAAWASVLGIRSADIPRYVHGLTPAVLR